MISFTIKVGCFAVVAGVILGKYWWSRPAPPPHRPVQVQQQWEIQPGQRVADYLITGGLGDVSIALQGGTVRAPFKGEVEPHNSDCVIFSSPEVPAYLFRLCGLNRPRLGHVKIGQAIGSAEQLQFATLRKQPDGTWAMVEPSQEILERSLAGSSLGRNSQ
jgi:hypothetical protein